MLEYDGGSLSKLQESAWVGDNILPRFDYHRRMRGGRSKLRRLSQSFMCRLQVSPLCMICIRECAFIKGLILLNG